MTEMAFPTISLTEVRRERSLPIASVTTLRVEIMRRWREWLPSDCKDAFNSDMQAFSALTMLSFLNGVVDGEFPDGGYKYCQNCLNAAGLEELRVPPPPPSPPLPREMEVKLNTEQFDVLIRAIRSCL